PVVVSAKVPPEELVQHLGYGFSTRRSTKVIVSDPRLNAEHNGHRGQISDLQLIRLHPLVDSIIERVVISKGEIRNEHVYSPSRLESGIYAQTFANATHFPLIIAAPAAREIPQGLGDGIL